MFGYYCLCYWWVSFYLFKKIFLFFCIKSFDDVQIWYKEIKANSNPDIKIILVGNKSDLEDKRKVSNELVQKFIKDFEIDLYFETSAKSGENVEKLFVEVCKLLHKEYSNINQITKKKGLYNGHKKRIVLKKSVQKGQDNSKCAC